MTIAAVNFWNFYYPLAVTASLPKPASQPCFRWYRACRIIDPLVCGMPVPHVLEITTRTLCVRQALYWLQLSLVLPESGMLSRGSALHVSVRVDFILSVHRSVDGKGLLFWNKQARWLKISWNDKEFLLFNNNIPWLGCNFSIFASVYKFSWMLG